MASAQSEGLRSLDQLDLIVDADSHVWDYMEELYPYIDDRYSWAKRMLDGVTGHTPTSVYKSTTPTPEYGIRHRGRIGLYQDEDESYSLDVKLREMDDYGIDFAIVDPGAGLDINTVANSQFVDAIMNGYNSWLLDQLDDDRPFKGTMLVAPDRPEQSAEEIDRVGDEENVVAASMPASGIDPPPGDSKYDPIYAAAEAKGLPITFHGSIGSTAHAWPTVGRNAETMAEAHAVGHPLSAMWNLTTILFRGVPERFPDLEFVYQESGLAWIPYLKWRLDDHYLENEEEMVLIDELPSEYLRRQFYFTTQPVGHTAENPTHLAQIVEMIGADSIMYSCDLPHPDHDPPQELFDRINNALSDEAVRGIMGENAADLYDIDY